MVTGKIKAGTGILLCILVPLIVLLASAGCSIEQHSKARYDYSEYVEAALEAVCKGEYKKYAAICSDSDAAFELHEKMITYVTEQMFNRYSVNSDCLDDVTQAEFRLLAANLLARASFETGAARQVNGEYKLDISFKSLNIWLLADAFCMISYENYQEKVRSGELMNYSDEAWRNYMTRYAKEILQGISGIQERVTGYNDIKTVTITVHQDENGKYYIDEKEWYAIIAYFIGMK